VSSDPEELDPELDVELGGDEDEDGEEDLDGIPDGFVVEGDDAVDDADDDADDADADDDGAIGVPAAAVPIAAAEETDDFEEELAPIVRVPEEEDDAPARRAGEFVCTSCYLVKRESQLAVRSRKVCRDCA
jgi:hypothetical protein